MAIANLYEVLYWLKFFFILYYLCLGVKSMFRGHIYPPMCGVVDGYVKYALE